MADPQTQTQTGKTIKGDWTSFAPDPAYPWRTVKCWAPADPRDTENYERGAVASGDGEWGFASVPGLGFATVWIPCTERMVAARTAMGNETVFCPSEPCEHQGEMPFGEWVDGYVQGRNGLEMRRVFRRFREGRGEAGWLSGAEACRVTSRSLSWIYRSVAQGDILTHKTGDRLFFSEVDCRTIAAGGCPKMRRSQERDAEEAEIRAASGLLPPIGGPEVASTQRDLPDVGRSFVERFGGRD